MTLRNTFLLAGAAFVAGGGLAILGILYLTGGF